MVKIIDKGLEEKLQQDAFNKFIDVAAKVTMSSKKFLMEYNNISSRACFSISNPCGNFESIGRIVVWPYAKKVIVSGEENYEIAMTLAKKYEEMTREEFTLIKE